MYVYESALYVDADCFVYVLFQTLCVDDLREIMYLYETALYEVHSTKSTLYEDDEFVYVDCFVVYVVF